jgi:CHAT domain-containing protein/tetratricopeptide (TPR) repeat protein
MNDRITRFHARLVEGSAEGLAALLDELPPSPMRDSAASFLQNDAPEMRVLGLNVLVTSYGFGQAANLGADLAIAGYPFARKVYDEQQPGRPLMTSSVTAIASSGLHALNLVGRYQEAVDFADRIIPDLENINEDANLPDILAYRIEALIGLNRLDDAVQMADSAERREKKSVHLSRLKETLAQLVARATKVARAGQATKADSAVAAAYCAQIAQIDQLGQFLTRGGGEMNEWNAQAVHRRIGMIFVDPSKGHDASLLRKALEELRPVECWARERGHTDVQNDTLWEMYLCQSRTGSYAEAAASLQQLRRNVEKRRAGISNRLDRAGVSRKFPHLYPALCRMLLESGQTETLLGAIEAAKGRAVADVMAERAGQIIDEAEFSEPASRLSELMRRNHAHYLSFLVDDDGSVAVLVAKDGSIHGSGQLPLGKERIRAASRNADPRTWGEPDLADPMKDTENVSEALEPLVAWLAPLFEQGHIHDGDHICYSPDENLHQLPLAYILFEGKPLVYRVSVSRIHGARALNLILGHESCPEQSFVAIEAPARDDLQNEEMVRAMRAPAAWLSERLPGRVYRDENATVTAILGAELKGRIVHFATHGIFPNEYRDELWNPFQHSGLVLAGPDGLPDKSRVARGEQDDHLLTPERLLEGGLDFDGSHVTLQACVTGLAREGIGGDALGLDWALMQAGASSLLSTHWNVDAERSSAFTCRFYQHWIEEGKSRAEAWRETALGMMAEQNTPADAYGWGAFSLSGDWR